MIYRIKATTEGSKNFLRMYEIKTSQTLYDLHEHIQSDLGYAPDQMIEFRTLNATGEEAHEYGLFDMGDGSIDTITMQDLEEREEMTLFYVFDMHNDRTIRLEIIEEDEIAPRKVYPLTSEEKGIAPDQFDPNKKDEKELPASRKPAPRSNNDDNLSDDDEDLGDEETDNEDIDDDEEDLDDDYGGMFGEEEEE